jgi:hypothetical protein
MKSASVKALFFLWSRTIINGIKRALGSPKRLISILVGLGYYVTLVMQPWRRTPDVPSKMFDKIPEIDPSWINHGVFFLFVFLNLMFGITVFGFRNTFKPADVDVLFPTPVKTRTVMLFRIFRDYSGALFFPLIIVFFSYRPLTAFASQAKAKDPLVFNQVVYGLILSWFLLSFAWVSISYALSFFVAKNEKLSRKISRIYSVALVGFMLILFGYCYFQLQANPSWKTVEHISNQWWIRGVMFLPWAATSFALSAFNQSILGLIVGGGVLVACSVIGLTIAGRLSGWMYDQAATRGFQSQAMRDFQRKGDTMAIFAARAASGDIKQGRLAKKLQDLKLRGGWALIYKEVLIQTRVGIGSNIVFLLMLTMFAILFLTLPEIGSKRASIGAHLYLGMVGFLGINFSTIQALLGYQETLRRVEVIKPLPLTASQIAFFETASKGVVSALLALFPFVVGFIYRPQYWEHHVAGMIASPMAALAMVGVLFLIVVLFPDFDDPTQRSFRGLMQLLGMLIVMAPTVGLFVGLMLLKLSPIIPAMISAVLNVGILIFATVLAGRYYADFNPSE